LTDLEEKAYKNFYKLTGFYYSTIDGYKETLSEVYSLIQYYLEHSQAMKRTEKEKIIKLAFEVDEARAVLLKLKQAADEVLDSCYAQKPKANKTQVSEVKELKNKLKTATEKVLLETERFIKALKKQI